MLLANFLDGINRNGVDGVYYREEENVCGRLANGRSGIAEIPVDQEMGGVIYVLTVMDDAKLYYYQCWSLVLLPKLLSYSQDREI